MQVFDKLLSRVRRNQLQFTPGGRFLAAGAFPFPLIDTADGSIRTFPELGHGWWAWTFIRNGAAIAILPGGNVIKVLDVESRKLQTIKSDKGEARGIAAVPTAENVYLTLGAPFQRDDAKIGVLNATSLTMQPEAITAVEPLYRLGISADGNWLAASHYYSTSLRVWHINKEKLPSRPSCCVSSYKMNYLALSSDGSHLAAVSSYGLTIWKTNNGEEVAHSGKHRRGVTAVACNPIKPILATGDTGGQVFFWDYAGNVLKRYEWGLREVYSLAFAPDALRCAAVDVKGKVVVWDVDV